MKKILLLTMIVAGFAASARANLIYEGTFNLTDPWPRVLIDFFSRYGHMQNVAGANIIDNQVVWSPFTPFGADRFNATLDASGTGFDLTGNLDGTLFRGMFVLVEGLDLVDSLYAIPFRDRFNFDGFATNDGTPLAGFVVTGTTFGVPDRGSTVMLLGLGIVMTSLAMRVIRKRS